MKIAIMQPYIFPYIGYFQLIASVDKFVFYDDVSFIKKGWINKNRILVNGSDFAFSIPIESISQNKLISETYIKNDLYISWCNKFFQTLEFNYKKAPQFENVYGVIRDTFNSKHDTISSLAISSIVNVLNFLSIEKKIIHSSKDYQNNDLTRDQRLIDICKKEQAYYYINSIGGKELYSKDEFLQQGIRLDFLQPQIEAYSQFNNKFVQGLSIIDILMFNDKKTVVQMINKISLV